MGRHLSLVVLAVQLACTLQAPVSSPNTNPMMEMMVMQMMTQNQDGRGPYGMQDELEADISTELREYMQRYRYYDDDDQEPLVGLLREFNNQAERIITRYKVEQNEDMITRAIIYDIFRNSYGPSEFAKNYLLQDFRDDMDYMDGRVQLTGMLLRQVVANPRGNNSDVARSLLYHLLSMLDEQGKNVMRMNILNMMSMYNYDHDAMELLMNLMNYMLSDDVAYEMESRDALLLLLQHYMSMQYFDIDKMTASLLVLRDMSSREDHQGEGILRSFVGTMILAGNRPSDIPVDEQWRFYPPGPCLVEDRFGSNINSTRCPHDFSCNVGPSTFNFNGRNQRYTMCAYPLENFVFHACEVAGPDGQTDRRMSCLPNFSCNFGPFTINSSGKQYRVKFCSDLANNTANYSTIYPVVGKSCSLEDEDGYKTMQRRCPHDMKCAGAKFPVMMSDNTRQYASMCHRNGHHYYDDDDRDYNSGQHDETDRARFMNNMMYAMMGYGDDITARLMSLPGSGMGSLNIAGILESSLGNGMEYRTAHHTSNNRSHGEVSEDFLNLAMATVLQDRQRGEQDEHSFEMYDEEYDVKLFRIMRYLVHRMAADKPLLVEAVRLIMEKHQLGVLRDVDRILMHGIIRYLLALWFHQQRDGQQMSGSDSEDFRDFMRYNFEHDRIQDNMEDLWRMIYERDLDRRQYQRNDDLLEMARYIQQRGSHVDSIYDLMRHYMDRERMHDLGRNQQMGYGLSDLTSYLMRTAEHDDQHRDMQDWMRRMSTGGTDSRNEDLLMMMLLQEMNH